MDQETLLPFDTPQNNNNIQNFTIVEKNNQNNLTFSGYSIYYKFKNYCILIILYILTVALILLYIITKSDYAFFFCVTSLLFTLILNIPYLLSVRKVKFIKNIYTNQITLKITRTCGCFKHYTLILENRYLFYQGDIFLLNILKNPSEIDLDNSNIKNTPFNLISKYTMYQGLKGTHNEIQLKIDEFLGQQKYENNIYNEINKYITLYQKNYSKDIKKIFDVYMKINEYYYTFFYSNLSVDHRTDFIYSKDFERLFIGVVEKGKYSKTFLINLCEIKGFEMIEKGETYGDDTRYLDFLFILYKNDNKEETIKIGEDKKLYLEKFVLLLNGKLNDINEMKKNNNNNNFTPQY